MLRIKNLSAGIEETQILKGINLEVNAGEVHAIMGPNGSGKSTLSSVIAGKEEYEVEGGEITFNGEDLALALKKLSVDSLSNIYPHPLYVFFHYSHPPLIKRLRALN